jgi:hypothetical protein
MFNFNMALIFTFLLWNILRQSSRKNTTYTTKCLVYFPNPIFLSSLEIASYLNTVFIIYMHTLFFDYIISSPVKQE